MKCTLATRSVVKFELLNSIQIEFQCWIELKRINSTQLSWVRLSIQLSQLDELSWTRLQIYFLPNFLSYSLLHSLLYFSPYFHHISHYIFYHISHQSLYQIPYQIDCKIDCKKKLGKKRKSILFLVHSILYLVTKIEFKQLNSILNWAWVERDQFNLNSNSDLSRVDFSQLNSTLTRRQIYLQQISQNFIDT